MDNVVFVALRKGSGVGSTVGYFSTAEEVPAGWTLYAEPRQDITGIMSANRCSKKSALELMNRHWH